MAECWHYHLNQMSHQSASSVLKFQRCYLLLPPWLDSTVTLDNTVFTSYASYSTHLIGLLLGRSSCVGIIMHTLIRKHLDDETTENLMTRKESNPNHLIGNQDLYHRKWSKLP